MMATIMATSLGVRDLKLHAPRLVERAAQGERIIITRYGKPRAVLAPISGAEAAGDDGSPRLEQWRTEQAAFDRLTPVLVRRYRGRFVAVMRGRVVDSALDHEALFQRVWARFSGRTFFIGRVGGPPPVVDMPGFEVE
jgi:prevent-host-death family protein